MKSRKENDFPAGPATPLLQQDVSGIAKSTFDISVIDEFYSDKINFSSVYPELKYQNIEKNIILNGKKSNIAQYIYPKTHFRFFNK